MIGQRCPYYITIFPTKYTEQEHKRANAPFSATS